jgi:hypothetical protein
MIAQNSSAFARALRLKGAPVRFSPQRPRNNSSGVLWEDFRQAVVKFPQNDAIRYLSPFAVLSNSRNLDVCSHGVMFARVFIGR